MLLLILSNPSIQKTKTWCVDGRHYNDTKNILEYEKVNPKTQKLVEIIKDSCSICGRKKSQLFTK